MSGEQGTLFPVPPTPAERQAARDAETRDNQRARLLAMLRLGPQPGNRLDREIGRRFGARLHELRKQGFVVDVTRIANGHGDYLYTLIEEPRP